MFIKLERKLWKILFKETKAFIPGSPFDKNAIFRCQDSTLLNSISADKCCLIPGVLTSLKGWYRLSHTKKSPVNLQSSFTDVRVRTCVKSVLSNRRIVKPFSMCCSSTQQIQEHKTELLLFFQSKMSQQPLNLTGQSNPKKTIQSCWSTIILVLDSITSVLSFVNWIKASLVEKLDFPDIKSFLRRGEKCGVESPRAQSFNLFV